MNGIQAMVNQMLAARMNSLPAKHKRIIDLMDTKTQREISKIVGSSLTTVNTVIRRHRGTL